ncbi:MAG: FAD-dependent oxidoreductase, partial [Rhodospirillaceae bacterium]|nr:FAD-dependent oxidoreductase [Rhodospirillaceae bacterium]
AFIGGTKGSHILLDHDDLHARLRGKMIYFESADSRICLVFPYLDKVLLGSTDIPLAEPDDAVCTDAEIDYLFAALHGIFPGLGIGRPDIVYTYSGVRPLVRSGADDPGDISRDHSMPALEPAGDRGFPVLSLVGGKWTTFRAFAQQTTDEVLRRLGKTRRSTTEARPIGGGEGFSPTPEHLARQVAALGAAHGTAPEHAQHLVGLYGARADTMAAFCAAAPDRPVAGLASYTERELTFLATRELVVHLEDLVLRRTPMAILGQLDAANIREVCRIVATALGWDAARSEAELERLRSTLSRQHRVVIGEDRQEFEHRRATS